MEIGIIATVNMGTGRPRRRLNTNKTKEKQTMTTMFVRHEVSDFGKWKQVYDDLRPTQQRLGVTAESVFRASDNPNDVTVTHEFASLQAAQAFVQSDDLRNAMQSAGVVGEPTIWFATRA